MQTVIDWHDYSQIDHKRKRKNLFIVNQNRFKMKRKIEMKEIETYTWMKADLEDISIENFYVLLKINKNFW